METSPSAGAENFLYAGEGGNGSLTYDTPVNGGNNLVYTPGATQDAGTITGTQVSGGFGGSDLTPLTFTNIGAAATVTFTTDNAVPADTLTVNGTPAADLFYVDGLADTAQLFSPTTSNPIANPSANLPLTDVINLTSIVGLNLKGNGGTSDIFDLVGPLSFPAGITVDGDATLDLSGATGAVGVTLGDPTVPTYTTITGFGTTVTAIGIDTVNLSVGANATTVTSTEAQESLSVSPTGANAASITAADLGLTVNVTNTGTQTLTVDGSALANTVTVNGTSGNDAIAALPSGADTTVQVNALQTVTLVSADTQALVVAGGLGNDTLTVNANGNTVPVAIPITYDGGTGTNALILRGTATADTYTPGSQLGAGTNTIVYAGGTETVNFVNLAPIFDFVAAPLVVNGTNADNAINYSVGYNNLTNFLAGTTSATWGQVSVDGYEPMEFINKTTLTINSLAGDDTINLNNPNTPTGLTGITVNGGDPGATDTLIANGTSGVDTINYAPTGPEAGSITGTGPTITFATIGQVTIDGQGGADALTVTTPANGGAGTAVYFTPGATANSGSFDFREAISAGGGLLTPMNFVNVDQAGSLTLASANPGAPTACFTRA